VSMQGEVIVATEAGEAQFNLERAFRANYVRVTRVIARVVRDPARAEELAVEVFLKLSRNPKAQTGNMEGWLYRVAVRAGVDELRRAARRGKYEVLVRWMRQERTPEEIHSASEEQNKVRSVLAVIGKRQAEFLVLRSQDFSYEEVAAVMGMNPASVGKLLSRAQKAFRKEYIKRYGEK
jgi:RNA polymerase sigma-70 factor, ECF subfamily